MKFPIEPLGENCFVERIDDYEGYVRGVDPMLRDKQGLRCKVLAAGPDASSVKPGDVVYIGRATGAELNLAGRHVLGLRERDILAVVPYAH